MSAAVDFLPDHGDLRAPASVIAWLAGDAASSVPDELAATSALRDGALHPRLEAARAIMREPAVRLRIRRGDREGRGWMTAAGSVLVLPLPDGRMRLVPVQTSLIVDALVRINEVGPRSRFEPGVRIAVSPGPLAEALAARDPARARLADPDQASAFARIVTGVREHWRVEARWRPASGAPGGRDLEVLDTQDGYWMVIPDHPTIELWPTTPTAVFSGLCAVFPRMGELA
jgi:hypothetical protein